LPTSFEFPWLQKRSRTSQRAVGVEEGVVDENTAFIKDEENAKREKQTWAESEFEEVALGDKRLEQRLKRLAHDFSERPLAPINQASEDWATTKAAYRFFENPKASEEKIFAAHRTCTVHRMRGQALVLAIQDTTYLNYSRHPQTQ